MFGLIIRLLLIAGVIYVWDEAHRRYVVWNAVNTPEKRDDLEAAVRLMQRIHSRYREARYTYELALRLNREAAKSDEDRKRVELVHEKFLMLHDGASVVDPIVYSGGLRWDVVRDPLVFHEQPGGVKVRWSSDKMAENTAKIRELTNELCNLGIFTDPLPLLSDQQLHEEARGAGYVPVYESETA